VRLKHIRNVGWEHEGKRPLGISWHRWEGNVRIDLKEVGWDSVDWFHLAWDMNKWWAVVNMVMKL
jgi:hypothetical protein